MILLDANLLIYAVNQDSAAHPAARTWWNATLSGTQSVGIAWIVALAFIRITTHRSILPHPLSASAALEYVSEWLAQPHVDLVSPGPAHWSLFSALAERYGVAGNLSSDVHLAALAMEQGATVFSADDDFRRFDGVKCCNPLYTDG